MIEKILYSDKYRKGSEKKFRTLFELANDVFLVVIPPDGNIVDVNTTAVKVLGYSKDELKNLTGWDIIAPEVAEKTNREWQNQIDKQDYFLLETVWVKKDGTRVPIEVSGKGFIVEGQSMMQIIGRDITDRKLVQERVEHRLIIENAIVNVSRELLSVKADLNTVLQIIGKAISVNRAYIFKVRDNGKKMDNTNEWCAPGTDSQIENLQSLDTSSFPWWMSKLEQDKNILISDIELMPLEANKEKEILKAQNVLSLIAVPLRNQDSGVIGFMGFSDTEKHRNWLLEDTLLLRIAGEMVDIINDSCKNMINVIDNASILSKPALGEVIETENLDLVDILRSVSSEFEVQLNKIKMKLELNFPESLMINANPIIAEIPKNYISNAIKYGIDGKKIIVNTEISNHDIVVNVKDYGVTIPQEKRESIFERTVQLNREKRQGRGLGLAIVKRIAKAYNAEIGVKPNIPCGNVFF